MTWHTWLAFLLIGGAYAADNIYVCVSVIKVYPLNGELFH
jgi:hypothetical protein